jgi:hypothetical protein
MTAAIVAVLMLLLKCAVAAAPVLLGVTPNPVGTDIYLHFSESLCPGPSLNSGADYIPNYTVTPPATIAAATLLADQKTVRLDFAPALNVGSYTLTVATLPTFEIYGCIGTNDPMVTPVSPSFVVDGTMTGPSAFYATPVAIGTDCGADVTVYGSGFDATATMELIPGSISGTSPVVNSAGTIITATFSGGIIPGPHSVVVKNPPAAIVFPNQSTAPYAIPVQAVTIKSTWPQQVGGCSSANITAYGGGFCPGATFDAIPTGGGTTVPGTAVIISPGGNQVSATFNFGGVPGGNYDLVVQNPSGGGSATAVAALNVSGIYAWSAYPNRVGDCGIQTLLISGAFCSGDMVQLVPSAGGTAIPGTVTSIVPAPNWGWGEIMTADFNLAGATPGDYQVEVKRGAGSWVATTVLVTILATESCPLDIQIVGRNTVGHTVVNTFTINMHNISCASVAASTLTLTVPASALPSLSQAIPGGIISGNVITYSIPLLNAGAVYPVQFDMLLPTVGTVINLSAASDVSGCDPVLHPVSVVGSQDPNSKEGLAGIGPNHRIRGDETLSYEIEFENLPAAGAPAQDVFINDRLNPAQFDLTTFSLGDITFGNHVITPPAGLTSYSDILPFDMDGDPATTDDQLLLVIDAKLITNPADPDYGRVTWSYRSLDPATLSTPSYVLLGFLPPNKLPPLGEGSVKFTVKLQSGLAFGTQFGSAAVVIFDQNPPIFTNPWFNEISPPVALSISNNMGQIELTWVGAPGDWILKETTQLGSAAEWTTVNTAPISISGGRQLVPLESLDQQKFFRLQR